MNDGAVLAQWLHTYEMDATTLASIFEAVQRTFPEYVVYQANEADIVLIARKGRPPGVFHGEVLEFRGAPESARAPEAQDASGIERRMVATSRTLAPMFRSYGIAANSDYFPVVEQRASVTRFTRANVNELTDLQSSSVPMLEMLDGGMRPADAPSRTRRSLASTGSRRTHGTSTKCFGRAPGERRPADHRRRRDGGADAALLAERLPLGAHVRADRAVADRGGRRDRALPAGGDGRDDVARVGESRACARWTRSSAASSISSVRWRLATRWG
jgi:hypothetical protein